MVDRALGASESRTSRKHLKWPSYRWRLVLVGAVISALVGGSTFYGLGAFFSPLQSEFNWSFSVLSGAFAVQYAVSGVATLIFGWFFDRIHPAYLAVIGILVTGLSFAALSQIDSTTGLYLAFAAMGIGSSAATFLLFNSLIALWFHRSLGLALAVVQTGYAIGGLTAAGFVNSIGSVGWRTTSLVAGAAIAVIGLPLCPLIRRPASHSNTADSRVDGSGVAATLRLSSFWVILTVIAISSAITQAVYAHQIRAMLTFGITPAVAGLAAGTTGLIGLAGRYAFGIATERISSRNLFAAAQVLQGAGTLALAASASGLSPFWFVVLFGTGQSAIFLLSPIVQRDYFGTKDFGTVQGLLLGPSLILSAVGPLVIGVTVDAYHSYRPSLLAAGFLAVGLAGIIVLARKARQDTTLQC